MITVQVLINGQVIMARSARNLCEIDSEGKTLYKCDTGEVLHHNREDGAVRLSHMLLDTIREP